MTNTLTRLPMLFALPLLGVLLLLWTPIAGAQHAMHDAGAGPAMALDTMPANDAVMAEQPDALMLHFRAPVRLVKLALRGAERSLLDIGFRYDPEAGHDFMQALPRLPPADYYTAEWAVIDAEGRLRRGNFHFAFGANARPPSYWLDQQEQMQHFMAPDYRLLNPN